MAHEVPNVQASVYSEDILLYCAFFLAASLGLC